MDDADWSLFRATGTVHLMVISGLHLTIVARWVCVGPRAGATESGAAGTRRLRSGPACVSAQCFVTFYACLAGWGVAVLRSWLATLLVLFVAAAGSTHIVADACSCW